MLATQNFAFVAFCHSPIIIIMRHKRKIIILLWMKHSRWSSRAMWFLSPPPSSFICHLFSRVSSSKTILTIGLSIFWGRSTSLRFKINNYAEIVAQPRPRPQLEARHPTTQRNIWLVTCLWVILIELGAVCVTCRMYCPTLNGALRETAAHSLLISTIYDLPSLALATEWCPLVPNVSHLTKSFSLQFAAKRHRSSREANDSPTMSERRARIYASAKQFILNFKLWCSPAYIIYHKFPFTIWILCVQAFTPSFGAQPF